MVVYNVKVTNRDLKLVSISINDNPIERTVNGNKGDVVRFTITDDWEPYAQQEQVYALFIWRGKYFRQNCTLSVQGYPECNVPVMYDTNCFSLGLCVGEKPEDEVYLSTKRITIPCELSIRDYANKPQQDYSKNYTDIVVGSAEKAGQYAKYVEKYADDIETNSKRITRLEQRITPNPFETDDTTAYKKDVPPDACPYAEIDRVGGMTYEEDNTLKSAKVTEIKSMGANLIPFPYVSSGEGSVVKNGVTFTIGADGSITAQGTSTAAFNFDLVTDYVLEVGTYTISTTNTLSGMALHVYDQNAKKAVASVSGTNKKTFTTTEKITVKIYLNDYAGNKEINFTIKPMLNKGASAAPHKPYRGDTPVATFTIPKAVQALEGYGEGMEVKLQDILTGNWFTARSYNYIDFEKRQFIRNVKTIKLSSLAWSKDSGGAYIAKLDEPTKAYTSADNIVAKAQHYTVSDYHTVAAVGMQGIGISGEDIAVLDSAHGTLSDFEAFIATEDITLCYELATPEIIDISHLISLDNFIEVEGGGSIIAVNEYMRSVPTEITYMLREATV